MYRVALCEDEEIFSDNLNTICNNILNKFCTGYVINVFNNSTDLLNSILNAEQYDMLLLDIIMDGINGIELARKIRELDENVSIIFITSSQHYTLQGYDVNALNYLIKPVNKDKLESLIMKDYHNKFLVSYIILESNLGKQRTPINSIIFLEIVGRKVEVTLTNGKAYYSGKLSQILEDLPKDMFVRCHQAFAINIANISYITSHDAVAVNGSIIPISRTFSKDVKKAFSRQLRDF